MKRRGKEGSDLRVESTPILTDLCLLIMFYTGCSNLAGVNKNTKCTTCKIRTFKITIPRSGTLCN